jgi:23S rRNA-/tRNA-specific pseudouridylate synthase
MRVVTPETPPPLIRGKPYPTITHISKSRALTGAHSGLRDHEIEIKTGVMHQIRCTLAHLGSPILGDPIYGGPPSGRLWLHAWRLVLPLANGTELALESALPPEWPVC